MKRNFLTALSLSVAMVGGMVANAAAADITFGGQLRPRFEVFEQSDFNDTTDASYLISSRIRLNVNAKINDKTSAFIQMQARTVYGSTNGGAPGFLNAGTLGNSSSGVPSDAKSDVGLHQAYFVLNDFFGAPVDLKFGRQEIVLDGHRLFGHTGWTQGAQAHDAIRLTHSHGEHTLSYMFISATESTGQPPTTLGANSGAAPMGGTGPLAGAALFGQGLCAAAGAPATGNAGGTDIGDACDRNEHVLHGNLKGILGGALSLYFVATDDNSYNVPQVLAANGSNGAGTAASFNGTRDVDNNIYTIGLRQAGQLYGIDYRLEGYYQFGEAEGVAAVAGTTKAAQNAAALAASAAATTAAGAPANALATRLGAATTGGMVGGVATPTTQLARWGAGGGSGVDREAYMFGVRVGKTFTNVMWKPSFTLWYDHLSGTDLEDAADNDWSTFDTLYDTGHKFYGYMDLYLNPTGTDTAWRGLQDLAAKMSIKPMANLTLKADIHAMWTETSIEDDLNDLGIADATVVNGTNLTIAPVLGIGAAGTNRTITVGDLDSHIGEELDLTAVYKYNPNTTISVGYSHFWADDSYGAIAGRTGSAGGANNLVGTGNDDDASWAYVQFDVKF